MKYPDPPFSFYLFSVLTLLSGSGTLAIKLCVSLFCSLVAVPSYLLVKRMTKSYVAAAISAFSITFSPGLISMGSVSEERDGNTFSPILPLFPTQASIW